MMHRIVVGVVAVSCTVALARGAAAQNVVAATQEARRAIAARDVAGALAVTDSLMTWHPDYPNTALLRARALMIASRPVEAEKEVRKLLGWDPRYARFALTDSILRPLAPRLADVQIDQLAAKADSPLSRGAVWQTLDERDLILEGTAWDPATRSLLLGSLHKNKIIAIAPDGTVSERVKRGDNGLASVVGIHVDSARGILWVASNRRYDTPADSTRSALYAFDAASGKFRERVLSPVAGPNFFNDITTGRDGTVYMTDTQGGEVWTLAPGADALQRLAAVGKVASPNGITISSDGRHLFVADLDHIRVVDLANRTAWKLAVPDSLNVAGIDGLAFAGNALIAHHPLSFWRIARYEIDTARRRITGRTLIERSTPDSRTSTTGEVVNGVYYYIGNGQIDRMNAGTIDFATMQPIRIYRAPASR